MLEKNKRPPPPPFPTLHYNKLLSKVEELRCTQLGAMLDDEWTADELESLFVPVEHRSPLRHVFKLQDDIQAYGEIYLNIVSVLGDHPRAFDSDTSLIKSAVLRFYFHRSTMPDGFVTPKPLFGTKDMPMHFLEGQPPFVLRRAFKERARAYLVICVQWWTVAWVLDRLQNSVRTPQQMRYVWPAIHTLCRMAELDYDLAQPSARAGMGAVPDPECVAFLKDTNDVLATSVLLGVNKDMVARHNRGSMTVFRASWAVGAKEIKIG